MNKNVVVFGAAGYIGSTLINLLLLNNYNVIAIDNFFKGSCDSLIPFVDYSLPNFSFRFGDITNEDDVKRSFENANYMVNAAALVGFPMCSRYPSQAKAVNVGGAELLVKHKPKETKLVYTNTGSVYGTLGELCTEDSPTNPPSLYGQTKLEAEKIFLSVENTIIHRYSTAFGVGFNANRVNLLINTLVWEALTNRVINIFEGSFKRSFIHVQDIASSIVHTLDNFDNYKHRVYNVGNPDLNFTKKEIALKIQEKTKCYVNFAETGKDFDVRNYEVSSARILSEGWKAKVGLDQGIDELIKLNPILRSWDRYN